MAEQPTRYVDANSLYSTQLPQNRVVAADDFAYLGNLQFVLFNIAQADLHLFVRTSGSRVTGLLWVQFEGFLPDNSRSYNYKVTNTARIGEHDYIYDFGLMNSAEAIKERPEGEWARISALLREKGYQADDEVVAQRFVRILDDARRNEFMIIYAEPLAETGLTRDDFAAESEALLIPRLLERARAGFTVEP